MQTHFTRRTFMQTAAVGAGALALSPTAKVLGANNQVRIGVVALGGRGRQLLNSFKKIDNVTVAGLCDVDESHLGKVAEGFPDAFVTTDVRKLLDRDDVDAIVSATPNHWHALLTIWGCQAGKHVYIEKPVSHTIFEGIKQTQAARKYKRIVSAGFQNRSCSALTPMFEKLHKGAWGEVKAVRVLTYRNRASIGKVDNPIEPPQGMDYDLWLGPAQDVPIYRPRFHYDWHWDFNTGDGDLGNQGPHETDLARWALGDPMGLPETVECMGGRYAWDDAGNTPNCLLVRMMYNGVPVTCETINLKRPEYKGIKGSGVAIIIDTDKAMILAKRGNAKVFAPDGSVLEEWKGNQNAHYGKFIDAIRANDSSLLTSEIESAAYSSGLAHISNIAYRVGDTVAHEEAMERFGHDEDLKESIARYAEIRKNAGVDPGVKWTYCPPLKFDSQKMHFIGDRSEAANPSITRHYRKGFEVPYEV